MKVCETLSEQANGAIGTLWTCLSWLTKIDFYEWWVRRKMTNFSWNQVNGQLLHEFVFGYRLMQPFPFKFEEWMVPLIVLDQERRRQEELWRSGRIEIPWDLYETNDLKNAYIAGCEGDKDTLDAYIGGMELAKEE